MRVLVFILTLLCLATSPALAQNGQGNGGGNGNGNSGGNGQENGSGNGNGNGPGQNSGQGNGNGNGNSGSQGKGQNNGNSNGQGNQGNQGGGPGPATGQNGTIHYTQDHARDAVSAGKAVSLASLLPDLQERAGGEVIDAELLNIQNILVYSIKVLRPNGRVTQEYYYAQSGRFIGSEP